VTCRPGFRRTTVTLPSFRISRMVSSCIWRPCLIRPRSSDTRDPPRSPGSSDTRDPPRSPGSSDTRDPPRSPGSSDTRDPPGVQTPEFRSSDTRDPPGVHEFRHPRSPTIPTVPRSPERSSDREFRHPRSPRSLDPGEAGSFKLASPMWAFSVAYLTRQVD
jgi:hypothetical protein